MAAVSLSRLLWLVFVCYAYAAKPKPAFDCDDDKIDAKYHNEACSTNDECFGHLMICKEGKCQCTIDAIPKERFVGERAKQITCDRAPGLNEKCDSVCLRPLKCLQRADNNEKVCLCQEPYQMIDGSCQLDCKEDEKYNRENHTCKKRCRANEVSIQNECSLVAELNGACQNKEQCKIAFSDCINGKCTCRPGFNANDGHCIPDKINCPTGSAIMNNNKPIACNTDDSSSSTANNGCPPGSICHAQQGFYRNSVGYCCPEVQPACPMGLPSTQFTCNAPNNTCPYESHYCHNVQGAKTSVCCPKPCPNSDDIYQGGKCYRTRALGGFCELSAQCSSSSTECREGRCRCREGYTQQGGSQYSYCEKKCQSGERLHDGQCHKILSLGDSCEDKAWLCPNAAFCNKLKVCACRCPYFTLVKDVCAPVPRCPGLKQYRPFYRGGMEMAAMSIADKGYQPISEADRQKTLENVTFCSFPPTESAPKVDAVSDCGAGKYCARYLNNLGMCCKKLETVCPNGRAPAEKRSCKRNDHTTCRGDEFCFDYLYTADPNSSEGTMCCPKAGLEDEE